MTKLYQSVAISILLAALPVAKAQDNQDDQPGSPSGITFGVKLKGGYAPDPWRVTEFNNLPASVTTVNYGDGDTYMFSQTQLKLHPAEYMLPFEFGPTISLGNRFDLAAGGQAIVAGDVSNKMQIGCYCVGSTVTYIQFVTTPVRIGMFGDASMRIKGPVWFTVGASTSPIWSNISVRQAFSAYNQESTLLKEHFGNYRVPVTVSAGMKFCGDCTKGGRGMYGFSVGIADWQNHVDAAFPGVEYPRYQHFLVVEFFLEGQTFFSKKGK